MSFLPGSLATLVDSLPRYILLLVLSLICLFPVFISSYIENQRQQELRRNVLGCRRLGLSGPSHLADEQSPKYSQLHEPWKIKALFIHPIKSCATVELDVADLSSSGLTWDRQFCFATWTVPKNFPRDFSESDKKQSRWVFTSLRLLGFENLIHVRPDVWVPDPRYETSTGQNNPHPNGVLVINYPLIPSVGASPLARLSLRLKQLLHLVPNETSFQVPLMPPPPPNNTYPLEQVSIWKELPECLNYGQHIPSDFRAYLNLPPDRPFTLFRASPNQTRNVFRQAPRMGTEQGQIPYQPTIAFADSYPIHLLNLSSVRDLAAKPGIATTIPNLSARRFRANIIVTGPKPYDEDDWTRLRVTTMSRSSDTDKATTTTTTTTTTVNSDGDDTQDFHCSCHTIRCKQPNVDPDTGHRHRSEPDKTLRSYRCIDPGDPNKAAMGLQLVAAEAGIDQVGVTTGARGSGSGSGGVMRLRVGDGIEVVDRGDHVYVKR